MIEGLSAQTMAWLRSTSTATLTTQLFRRGLHNTFLQRVRALGNYASPMIGPAFTLRYVPAREDLDSFGVKPDPNAKQR